jgi:hypothetical protein
MGSVVISGGLPSRPSLVLPSISVTEDTPNVIRYSEADMSLEELFPILSMVSTTTVWATPPREGGGLGYTTEPSALAFKRKQASTSQQQSTKAMLSTACEDTLHGRKAAPVYKDALPLDI